MMRWITALLLLVCGACPAIAGEDAADPKPAKSDATSDAAPLESDGSKPAHTPPVDPQPTAAFEWAGEMWWGDRLHAQVRFDATHTRKAERVTWHVRDQVTPPSPDADRMESVAELDASLHVRTGTYERRNPRGFLTGAYYADAQGRIQLEHRTSEYVNRTRPPGSGPATATLAAWILRCRSMAPDQFPFRAVDFDPDPPLGDPVRMPAVLMHHGVGRWRMGDTQRDASIFSLTRGRRTWRMAFDPQSKAFLGLSVVGLSLCVSPKGAGVVGLAPPFDHQLAAPVEISERLAAGQRRRLALPSQRLSFDGVLTLDDGVIGSVLVNIAPTSVDGQPAWHVTESVERKGGAATVRSESTLDIAQDLAVLQGETLWRSPSGTSRWTYEQTDDGMRIATEGSTSPPRTVPTRQRPVLGVAAVWLFLREVPLREARYVLPGFDPRSSGAPKAGSGAVVSNAADVTIQVKAETADETELHAHVQLGSGRHYDVVLDRRSRALLRIKGHLPRADWAASTDAAPIDWFVPVTQAPQSARQAFVLFGRGYHLARRDWLERAFHWPTMSARSKGQNPETLRNAWIGEFMNRSKHRTLGDCDDLLMQIFLTMQAKTHSDGSVSYITLPVYGGHTYRMREIGSRWWVVQID